MLFGGARITIDNSIYGPLIALILVFYLVDVPRVWWGGGGGGCNPNPVISCLTGFRAFTGIQGKESAEEKGIGEIGKK